MFEEYTFDSILERMMSGIDPKLDKREGSVIYDALAPMAHEFELNYINLDRVLTEVFADTASFYYLIKRCAERGIFPREASAAVCKLVVTPDDTPITVGDRFNLDMLNYTVTGKIEDEPGTYELTCETEGVVGNQQLGQVLVIETAEDVNMMKSAEITDILVHGEDEEDVEDFRERYYETFSNKAFGGNTKDYKDKVTAMQDVGACKVLHAWEGGYEPSKLIPNVAVQQWVDSLSKESVGEAAYAWLMSVYAAAKDKLLTVGGTVKVYIINSEYKAPSQTLIKNVQNELDPEESAGNGEALAPIGHVVRVIGVKEVPIDVEISAIYKDGYSFSILKDVLSTAIDKYFNSLAENWDSEEKLTVRIRQLEARLLTVEGIVDISHVSLNGIEDNITLSLDEIPVRGDVNG